MDKEKRYCSIEESLIEACKEVNLMRKGLMPKIDTREAMAILRAELKDDLEEKEIIVRKKKVAVRC